MLTTKKPKMARKKLIRLQEPRLLFRHNQALEDPRDGLALFGPVDDSAVFGVRAAVIGTKEGIKRFGAWVKSIQHPITNDPPVRHRPPFPGFQAAFGIPWHPEPVLAIEIREDELTSKLHLSDKYHRIFQTVEFFSSRIIQANKDEDVRPDLWFVVIPDEVHKLCRPQSVVAFADRIEVANTMPVKEGQSYRASPSLFEEWNEQSEPYQYEPDFHSQIKARLLRDKILTQIVRESTIAPYDFLNQFGRPIRSLEVLQSEIAWNLSSATYYKAGAKPWKLDGVRQGVCYVGLVFKRDEKSKDPSMACCAAQMFLDSGDGVVFKGQLGPWYTGKRGHYHLTVNAASQLLDQAIRAYKDLHNGARPNEIFIHGRTRFDEPEWNGFLEAAGSRTQVTGVRIRKANWFRLYRHDSEMPILRGLTLINSNTEAFLATKGFTPRLQTYPGLEVPVPLFVDVCRGETEIKVVLQDIMGLTKLNYNSCRHSDGLPVTLKFADAVGEILVSGPIERSLTPTFSALHLSSGGFSDRRCRPAKFASRLVRIRK